VTQTIREGKPVVKRRSKAPWFLWLAGIAIVIAIWVLYFSKYLLVEKVEVTGASRVTPARIAALTHVHKGQPLIRVDPHKVTKDIAVLPQVKSVTVERSWPHTVIIHVVERKPIAAAVHGTSYILVDEEGNTAGIAVKMPAGMRIIYADPDTHAMRAAVDVMNALPATWKVVHIEAPTQDSVSVQLDGGKTVILGSSENLAQKFRVAGVLLAKGFKWLNVGAPDAPAVK